MSSAPATPPKFVPTLTEEVSLPVDLVAEADEVPAEIPGGYELPAGGPEEDDGFPEEGIATAPPAMLHAQALPPELVANLPELTEVAIEPLPEGEDTPAELEKAEGMEPVVEEARPEEAPQPAATVHPSPLPEGYEEIVIHRVMQRVDVMLEQRLKEAIATVIQEQTRSIVPRLREEVESVVRQSVYEAVADELASVHHQ